MQHFSTESDIHPSYFSFNSCIFISGFCFLLFVCFFFFFSSLLMFFPFLVQAAAFCAHFDLQLTEDEVHFARSMSAGIKLQEKALPPKKSVPLVLSKNSKCLGEVSSNCGCYTALLHQIQRFPLFTCSYTVLLHHYSAVVTKCYIIGYHVHL